VAIPGDGIDDADAIQAAVDTSGTIPTVPTGKDIYVPGGQYLLSHSIDLPSGIKFRG